MTKKIFCMKNNDVFDIYQETALNKIPERCVFCEHGICRLAVQDDVWKGINGTQQEFAYDNSGSGC